MHAPLYLFWPEMKVLINNILINNLTIFYSPIWVRELFSKLILSLMKTLVLFSQLYKFKSKKIQVN